MLLCCLQRQQEMIARFREGTSNVLVATNIGSEGMDFRQCQVRAGCHCSHCLCQDQTVR